MLLRFPPLARCSPQTLLGACRQRYQPPFQAADKPGESGSFAWGRRAWAAKEGAFWAMEEGDGSGIHWGHHLPSRTRKDP